MILFEKANTPDQLAALYSAADVLYNPTREDNYPTVNLEAQACGTPVVTYDVGGCRETVSMEESFCAESFKDAVAWIAEYSSIIQMSDPAR